MKILLNNVLIASDQDVVLKNDDEKYAEFKISTSYLVINKPNNSLVIYGTFSNGEKMIAQSFTSEVFKYLLEKEKNIKITLGRMRKTVYARILQTIKEEIAKI